MRNIYKYLAAFLILGIMSCESKLELEPAQSISGDQAVTSEELIENILLGVYDEAGQGDSHGGSLQMIADLIGSDDQITWGGTFLAPAEIKERSILPDNGFVEGFWDNAYEVINQANIVLDNLNIIESSAEKRSSIEGQARFLRALEYFDLNRHFSSGGKGVALRTSGIFDYSVDLSISRASTDEVYNLVKSDLEAAIGLLPESNEFFADRYSAQALLARVNLYLGDFSAAAAAADNVINNSGHALASTFAEAFNNDADGVEDIFAFQVTSQTGDNDLIIFYASEGNGGRGGDITVNDEYVAIFDDPNDARSTFFYESPENGGRLTGKYVNEFGNVPILRMAEMHLVRAEANMMAGTEVGASPLDDVNTVRARAGAAPLGEVTREVILMERQRELAFEGFFIHDVQRTGGSIAGIPAGDPRLTFPIPQDEMDTNASMEQNPGY